MTECLVHRILAEDVNDFHLISPKQFCFCKNTATEVAIIKSKEMVIENIENKLYITGIFVHIRKAFGSVNYGILLGKINSKHTCMVLGDMPKI